MGANLSEVLKKLSPDVVFNCLHGTYGEDGCVPGLLNIMRIPYTNSGVVASALAFNKVLAKHVFDSLNILNPAKSIISLKDFAEVEIMKRPYVIKPIAQGSSIGVEIVFPEDNFSLSNYKFAEEHVLLEEYIPGQELQVAVLNGKALGVLELELLKSRFYDYETKYTEGLARHILPANVPDKIYNQALHTSEKIYDTFHCRGLVRIEYIYSKLDAQLYVLEVNTHPGMTTTSICQEIAAYSGITFEKLLIDLIQNAKYD